MTDVSELIERRYLLMKRGLYYRPDSNGYTGHKDKAGRFLQSDASPEHGVFAVHEDEAALWSPGCGPEVMQEIANARIQSLSERVAGLEDKLRMLADEDSWKGFSPMPQIERMREFARDALTKEGIENG